MEKTQDQPKNWRDIGPHYLPNYQKCRYYILETKCYYNSPDKTQLCTPYFTNQGPLAFETKEEAQTEISILNSQIYELDHNEYDRPTLRIATDEEALEYLAEDFPRIANWLKELLQENKPTTQEMDNP